jgi:hypothetical protein
MHHRNVTPSVPPKLRNALLSLSRDDALRRAYLRRCWLQSPDLGMRLRRSNRQRSGSGVTPGWMALDTAVGKLSSPDPRTERQKWSGQIG